MIVKTPPAELLPVLDELAELLADAVVRVMVAEKAAKLPHGGDRKSENQNANLHLDRQQAAAMLNVSQRVEFSTPAQPQEVAHEQ